MGSIKVIGESCFIFSNGINKIITDPWFGESIYGGAWSQFPIPSLNSKELKNISHIFISHVHADHCCISSLKKIFKYSPEAQILILNRIDQVCYLKKKLLINFGDEILQKLVMLDPYKLCKINNFRVWCLPPETDSINDLLDSSLLIEDEKGLTLFSNDNLPTKAHADFINSLNKSCYLALIPFSGGSGYPACYTNIEEEDKLIIAGKIRKNYEKISIDFLNQTKFKYFMPVAGNHIISGKSFDWHKSTSFLLNPYKLINDVNNCIHQSKGIYFEPNETIDEEDSLKKTFNSKELEEDFEFRKSLFIESFSSRIVIDAKIQSTKLPNNDWIGDYFNKVGSKLKKAISNISNKKIYQDYNTLFIINSKNISLFIGFNEFLIKDNCEADFFNNLNMKDHNSWLAIKIDPIILFEILNRNLHINEADAGGLLTYNRNGPYFDDLYTILFTEF